MIAIYIIFYAIIKAIKDKISFHYHSSIFMKLGTFWNPVESWRFKYKNNDPKQGERFKFSTTILVSLTDAWHLLENIQSWLFCIVLASYKPIIINFWVTALIFKAVYIIVFHVLFTYVFNKKQLQ